MINEARLVELFQKLCLIDAPALREQNSVAYVKEVLIEMGLEVEEDDAGTRIGGEANNLIAILPGNVPDAPRIFLSAHFDTVEPTEGLIIGEENGVFHSVSDTILGADDKGGMAPCIEAVRAIMESGTPHGPVCLLFTVAEEIGLKGAAALKIEDYNLDMGFVFDTGPPVGSFVTKTAYHDRLDIQVIGKPAHSGKDPEKGISAIQVVADAVHGMKLGRIAPETTANIGLIEGGSAVNVVCANVRLRGEARSTSLEELDAQIDHMIQRFESAAREWGAQVKIEHERHYGAYDIPADSRVVKIAQQASAKLGLDPFLRTTLGGSDANIYNQKGVPTIVVATGMDKIHTHDEHISRVDLVNTAKLAFEIIVAAASSAP